MPDLITLRQQYDDHKRLSVEHAAKAEQAWAQIEALIARGESALAVAGPVAPITRKYRKTVRATGKDSQRARVLAFVQSAAEPVAPKAIGDALSIRPENVRAILQHMKGEQVESPSYGVWRAITKKKGGS